MNAVWDRLVIAMTIASTAVVALLATTPLWGAATPVDPAKELAFQWVDHNAETVRRISLNIWNTPELAMREFKSSRELIKYLQDNRFHVKTGVAGLATAFIATYGSGKPVIGIYGEYDALPGLSQKPEPMRAPVVAGAPGHGCGHNLIGAGTAAAAVAVSKLLQAGKLKGTLRYYGTPAEESLGGKNYLLEAGLFDDVDTLLGWHPHDRTWAGFQYSKAFLSVHFTFKGVASHPANAPQLGRSALKAAELLDVGVNFMREHLKDGVRISSVLTTSAIQPNVIPAEAESWYYIRTNKHQDLAEVFDWISDIAKGAALMTRTQVESRIDYDSHELMPNRPLAELVDSNLRLVGPPQFTDEEKDAAKTMQGDLRNKGKLALEEIVEPLPGTPEQGFFFTDLGNVSWKVPTQVFEVASYPYSVPIHTWQVTACAALPIGQRAMIVAAKTLAATAIDLFENPALRDAAKNDLDERLNNYGYTYRLLTPPNRKPPMFQEQGR